MSRTVFGKPEFRLAMNHTHITITRHDVGARRDPGTGEAPEPEPRAFDLGSPTLIADLRRLGAEIRAARGRLTVILPEGEVWRGRLALGEAKPRERGRIARAQAAAAMGLPLTALAVRLGRLDRDGTLPAAAVSHQTLAETRSFLARAGLKPTRITGSGTFDGFAAAPQLDTPPLTERLRPIAPALGGAIAAAAVVALLIRPGGTSDPEPVAMGPMPLAVTETDAPAVAETASDLTPRSRPTDLVILRPAPEPEPVTATAEATAPEPAVFRQPVTMGTRNIEPDDLPPARAAESRLLRLGEVDVARARTADTVSGLARLRPGGLPAANVPEVLKVIRNVVTGTADAPIMSGATEPTSAVVEPAPVAATPPTAPAVEATPETAPAAITAPRPPQRPAALARQAAAPAPAPAPEAAPEPEVAATPTTAPTTTANAAPAIAPPPARPESAAAAQVAEAVGAAVVAAGIDASTRSSTSGTQVVAESISRPAPRRDFRPVRVAAAATPAVSRPATTRQAAPQPARATQRTAAAQPQRQPARQVAAQPARQLVAAQPARKAAAQPTRRAAAQPARQAAATPRRAAAAQRPASNNPTSSTTAAAAATQHVNLSRRGLTLIGVFGPESARYAMVRLSNGSVHRVKAGDRVQGARVAAVGQSTVQFANNGRTTTLAMP